MAELIDFMPAQHDADLQLLLTAYLEEGAVAIKQLFDVEEDIDGVVADDMHHLDRFAPPNGRLLLVVVEDEIAGTGSLRTIRPEVAEVKRMYLRPEFRGRGLGRQLLDGLLATAAELGCSEVYLDTHQGVMPNAIGLYRTAGFEICEPYPESEIPEEFHDRWIFMKKLLAAEEQHARAKAGEEK